MKYKKIFIYLKYFLKQFDKSAHASKKCLCDFKKYLRIIKNSACNFRKCSSTF